MTTTLAGDGVAFNILNHKTSDISVLDRARSLLAPNTPGLEATARLGRAYPILYVVSFKCNTCCKLGQIQRHFSRASTLGRHIQTMEILRLSNFVSHHGLLPTIAKCKQLLAEVDFANPRLKTLTASPFVNQVRR